jgi:hypothetical protein
VVDISMEMFVILAQHQASTKDPGQIFALSTRSASTEPTLSRRGSLRGVVAFLAVVLLALALMMLVVRKA